MLPQAVGVKDRGYTTRLQRAISDFGCERSFSKAVDALQEHYGLSIPISAAREITYKQARRISQENAKQIDPLALPSQGVEQLICQADGCMIGIVQCSGKGNDKRRKRNIDYREARLCASQALGSASVHYQASFQEVNEIGKLWAKSAKDAGRALNTKIHVVSDGAIWIQKQAQSWLSPDRHLLDYYHICEYLADAQSACATNKRWFSTQKNRLKTNRSDRVVASLKPYIESSLVPDEQAPVRSAHRYLSNRSDQLDFQGTLQEELPIGSGMIESGHKHVIQSRLKIAGASWTLENAELLLQARTTRANRKWAQVWKN